MFTNIIDDRTPFKLFISNGTYGYKTTSGTFVAFRGDSTATYTYASGSTGGTVDLGARNNYRYVNATNVYNKGKEDGNTIFMDKTKYRYCVTGENKTLTEKSMPSNKKVSTSTLTANLDTVYFFNTEDYNSVTLSGNAQPWIYCLTIGNSTTAYIRTCGGAPNSTINLTNFLYLVTVIAMPFTTTNIDFTFI